MKSVQHNIISITILCLLVLQSYAQKKQQLHVVLEYPEKTEEEVIQSDSSKMGALVDNILQDLRSEGHLTAHLKSYASKNNISKAVIQVGQKYYLAILSTGNLPAEIQKEVGFKEKSMMGKPMEYPRINRVLERIIDVSEQNGLPFASARLDSIKFQDSLVSLQINYRPGPFIEFDSISVEGNLNVKKGFLMSYLGIIPEEPYNQKLVDRVAKQLAQLRYIEIVEQPYVRFFENKATLQLNLNKRKVNRIDGLLGVLPNQAAGNNILINGYVNLNLYNLFASGKHLLIDWRKTDNLSQFLDVVYEHPNFLKSPLGWGFALDLLKQDTSFLNTNIALDIFTNFSGGHRFNAGIDFEGSRLIATSRFEGDTVLPDAFDYDINYYRIGYESNQLNDVLFPSGGSYWNLQLEVGQKNIRKNQIFDEQAYDGLALENTQLRWKADVEQYVPVARRMVIKAGGHAGMLLSDQLFQNELFRLGGLNTIRGFPELSIFATDYVYGNVEFRYLLEHTSMIYAFVDAGYINEKWQQSENSDTPFSAGIGLELDTKNGIFTFIYALGQSKFQPFSLNFSNIHFGYTSRF
jgi:translocation and assembly module TamA